MRSWFAAGLVAASLIAPLCAALAVGRPESRPRKIVIASMPTAAWEDVEAGLTPNLRRLADDWSIGALSVRTVEPLAEGPALPPPDLASAMATIGAGNRALADILPLAQGDIDAAPNAVPQPDGSLKVRGMRRVAASNARLAFGARPGLLGTRLRRLGLDTGVAGNADGGVVFATSEHRTGSGLDRRRFGALALAGFDGRVNHGQVGDALVTPDRSTLNGYRTHLAALLEAATATIETSDVALIELNDSYREAVVAFADLPGVDVTAAHRTARDRALKRDDAALGELVKMVDLRRDSLLVVSPTGLGSSEPERLSLALLAGVGAARQGWLTSAVTQRDGLVTISDIGPGILRLLGAPVPGAMNGQPLHAEPAHGAERLDRMMVLQDNALFHGRWVGMFFALLVLLEGVLYLLVWRRLQHKTGPSRQWLRWSSLAFMATPLAVMALIPLRAQRWGPAGPLLLVAALCTLVVLLALRGPWSKHPAGPPSFVAGLTVIVVAADLLTGARLQMSSLVGYSPIVAGRFYGIGNLTFALLATSALLLAGHLGHLWKRRGLAFAAVIGVLIVLVDGHPRFGADFGGVLALIPGFGVLLLLLAGRRMSILRAAVLGALAVAAGLLAGILDSMRPLDRQTHIGRFVQRLLVDGPGGVAQIIERKAQANWALLTQSVLAISIPLALIFLAIMLRDPNGKLLLALNTDPGLRYGLIAAAVTNLLGFALNDSGVAIPAMGLAMAAPFCLATILGLPAEVLEE